MCAEQNRTVTTRITNAEAATACQNAPAATKRR